MSIHDWLKEATDIDFDHIDRCDVLADRFVVMRRQCFGGRSVGYGQAYIGDDTWIYPQRQCFKCKSIWNDGDSEHHTWTVEPTLEALFNVTKELGWTVKISYWDGFGWAASVWERNNTNNSLGASIQTSAASALSMALVRALRLDVVPT